MNSEALDELMQQLKCGNFGIGNTKTFCPVDCVNKKCCKKYKKGKRCKNCPKTD